MRIHARAVPEPATAPCRTGDGAILRRPTNSRGSIGVEIVRCTMPLWRLGNYRRQIFVVGDQNPSGVRPQLLCVGGQQVQAARALKVLRATRMAQTVTSFCSRFPRASGSPAIRRQRYRRARGIQHNRKHRQGPEHRYPRPQHCET